MKKVIINTEQIKAHHDGMPKIDLADAKYDIGKNYDYIRSNGSIPLIDYNPRKKKRTVQALRDRGYDENGWPFAPCWLPAKPNGFDKSRQRHAFCCFKQCLGLNAPGIRDHPGLLNEVLRGTSRYRKINESVFSVQKVLANNSLS